MAKALNIDLNVNANTSQARQELSQLQNTLKQLTTASGEISKNLTTGMDLSKTIAQVTQLRTLLQSATNVDTGVLNFTKLNQSIQQANTSLLDYGRTLNSLGPTGQKAFQQLATAVSKSEIPISQTNGMLKQFGTTMKNTLRWQASSMLLHGTVNAIQKAWNYAQKLDRSLTDIQIVTKQSDAQMAKFAENANKAARALSTSTTAYTDAALIYYQQGLNDAQVKQRTDVTVKMANVTGRTAEKVSDQMTAIWNNFDDGSKSLEYYADVITALGAATASSSDEIATGLSKFAAVADTVGLSYENATAALATITATTRQSADSVGNGLKTLFSRLQSLSLGQTLEDGVNLTKYTKALNTVGVSALDAAGNLRSMDSILADLGERWDSLSSAQQNALAQTVGGVRQYVTFTALMDNYDFFKDNIQIAKNASGELQKQADIYDKSWAAARKHVQASAEAIYSDLIDDKFFTGLTNGFAGLLHQVDNLIDGIGGIKGVLLTAGTAFATFNKQGTQAFIQNTMNGIQTLFPSGARRLQEERSRQLDEMTKMIWDPKNPNQYASEVEKSTAQGITRQIRMQEQFTREQNTYSPLQMMYAQQQMADMETLNTNATNFAQQVTDLEAQRFANLSALRNFQTFDKNGANAIGEQFFNTDILKNLTTGQSAGANYIKMLSSNLNNLTDQQWMALDQTSQTLVNELANSLEGLDPNIAAELRGVTSKQGWQNVINSVSARLNESINTSINKVFEDQDLKPETRERLTNYIRTDIENQGRSGFAQAQYADAERKANEQAEKGILQLPQRFTAAQGITEAASMLGGLGMGLSIMKSGIQNLSNPNMSAGDKALSLMTSFGMGTMMLNPVIQGAKNSGLLSVLASPQEFLNQRADQAVKNLTSQERTRIITNRLLSQEHIPFTENQLLDKNGKPLRGSALQARQISLIRQEQRNNLVDKNGRPLRGAALNARIKLLDKQEQIANEEAIRNSTRAGTLASRFSTSKLGGLIGRQTKGITSLTAKAGLSAEAGTALAGAAVAAEAVAAIAAVAIAIKLTADSIESEVETINRYQSNIDNASAKAQKVSEEYSTLVSNVDTHNKQLNKLNELEVGSLEYRQAQIEANKTASEIIANNNLTPEDYTIENGIYKINEEALKNAQENALDAVMTANTQEMAAKAVLSNYTASNRIREIRSSLFAYDELTGDKTYDYSQIATAKDYSQYNDNEILSKIGKDNNLGSGAEVARLIAEGKLEEQLMITSGAAASNQMLLSEVATQMNNGQELNDLQRLIIDDLADNVTTSNELADAANKGVDSAAITWRSLGHFRKQYIQALQDVEHMSEAEAEAQMRKLEQDETYLNADRHGKQVILTSYIANMRATQTAQDLLTKYQDTISQSTINYSDWDRLDAQQLQDRFYADIDEKGNVGLTAWAKSNLTEAEQNFNLEIFRQYQQAFQGVSELAAAAGFSGQTNVEQLSKFNIAQLKQIQAIGSQFKQQFGAKGLEGIFESLVSETDDFRDSLQDVIGDDAIQTLFNLKDKDWNDEYQNLRTELGDKGLFEALYDSEGFKSSLESLNETFEEMGSISASNVLKLADSSKTLSNYLDLSGTNAQGLADTIAALASGDIDINRLSDSLVKAYSATGIVASNLADSYKYISDYEKGTSIETIPNFYESLEGTIYKSVKAGNLIDEPVLNAIQAILGTEGRQQWMLDAARASGMGFTAGNQWMLNESASASQWKTISQIYKTGNMQPIFAELFNGTLEGFDLDQEINGIKLSDIFRYGNGEIQTYLGDKGSKFTDAFKTQEDFIQFLLKDNVLGQRYSEETIRNAVSEYTNKNEALNLAWTSNGIIAGIKELVNVDQTTNADNLRKFLNDNSLLIGAMTDEQKNELATTLGISPEALTFDEKGKLNNTDQIVSAATRKNHNIVNLNGLDYDNLSYDAIAAAYNDEQNNNQGNFVNYLTQGLETQGLRVVDLSNYSDETALNEALAKNYQRLAQDQKELFVNAFLDAGLDPLGYMALDQLNSSPTNGKRYRQVISNVLAQQNNDDLFKALLGDNSWNIGIEEGKGYDLDDIITKFTDLGFAAEDALKWMSSPDFSLGENNYLTRQVWDATANEGAGAFKTEVQQAGETAAQFQKRTGGTNDEYMAELQHQQALIDAANAMIMAQNATKGKDEQIDLLNDILTATGEIKDNTGATAANTAANQKDAGTVATTYGTNEEEAEEVLGAESEQGEGTNIEPTENEQDLAVKPAVATQAQPQETYTPPAEEPDLRDIPLSDLTFDQWQQLMGETNDKAQTTPTAAVTGGLTNLLKALELQTKASGQNNHIPGFASGYQGPATVGELGPETWIHDGQMDIVGQKGRETIWVNPSDTILTAGQTDRLLDGYKPGFDNGWYGAYKPTGGGGGVRSGGSGGKKEDDDEKWKDSWEPYHEISREVQRLTTDVENLNTEMERAFGVEKIQKMDEELELLDQRLQQEADYIAEAEKYIAEYAEYLPDGTEVVDGVIQNYDALQEKYLKDIYEAQEKRDKDKLEKLQREWQKIQQYEQHTDKLEERRQEQLKLLYQQADLMLQQLQYSIDQINSSLDESESLIEYMLNHMNTDMFKMAESIALVGDATDITIQKMEQAKQSIQDYEDMLGTEYANDEELVNNILQERNNLLKLNQELDKQRDNVIKKLTYTIQEFNNEQKKATKLLSNYNTLIKNYTDLSELMGLSTINNTEQIDKLNDALKNNMGLNIQATKSQLETNQAQIAQMEADFEANPWMREAYDDVYQKLIEEGQGLSVTLSNNLQSMLNFIVKEFETELDRALTSFQDQITKGFGTWDELTSAANSLKGAQEVNTKAYDRVYQLNTLIRDMDSYMNDMTSTKNHNSILKFQEQIKKLKADNTDQSQEELDVLRAQFELMQAQFDLEDAQNAKNQVRLQRDMNGNWGYVYTADEDAMAEAQQNVDDKLKAYLDAVTALQQVQGEYMSTVAELEIQEQELRNELNQLGHTDEDEERRAQLLKQIAELENQQNIYRQSLDRMEGSLNDAIEIGRNNINEIWDENVDLQAALKDLPMLILAGQQTTVEEFFDTLGKAEGKFIERTDAAKDAYMEQYEEWAPYLKEFNDGLGNMADQSQKAVTNLDALNEQYLQEFTTAMEAAVKWEQEYGQQMQNIIEQNLEFIQSITDMINGLREVSTIVPSISFRNTADTSQVAATIASMDSGGYTGAWGTSGKIAMLHEKEQVFNAQDTQNLLTAAQILRTIDASANSMAIGLNNMITPKIDGVAQQIDQKVSISASFPNVVNHLEIEEAFNNLTNKAMQYANRKNA